MKKLFLKTSLIIFTVIAVLCPISGMGQSDYPNQPITLIVGFGAGGNTDVGLRILAESASKNLGQPIVVENKPGAGGYLGFSTMLNSKPDGYTIGALCPDFYTDSLMNREEPDKVENTTVIGLYTSVVHGIVAKADAPWNTFKDVIEYAKAHPGKVTYGAITNAHSHLTMIKIGEQEKINWKAVPYRGTSKMVPALLGGHIDLIAGFGGRHLQHVKAGKVKLLVSMGNQRLPYFPDVPTLKELGYDVSVSYDIGLGGPKGIPASNVQKLQDAFAKASKEPEFQNHIKKSMMVYNYMGSEQYSQYLKQKYDFYAGIIKDLGLAHKK